MIKEETIVKTLNFLNETKKKIAENNLTFNPKLLSELLHVSNAKYYYARKLGYFSSTNYPDGKRFYCHITTFEPYHARTVIEAENKKHKHRSRSNRKDERSLFETQSIIERPNEIDTDNERDTNKDVLIFTPPTLSDVEKYCNERRNHVPPAKFIAYYNQKGWMIGKNKMKNWKMAIHTWEQQDYKICGKKLSEYTIEELINELKRRGYSGNIHPPSNEINF